jgi:hypothetical protein
MFVNKQKELLMNFRLTLAAGLLTAVSGVVLAQGTINTNNFANNTSEIKEKTSQTLPNTHETGQKKGWQFSYNGSIGYGSWEDSNGDKADNSTPINLGLAVQNGGFYAGLLGHHENSELNTYIDTGYVYKMPRSILLAAEYGYIDYGDDSSDYDSTVTVAGAWKGLGLLYGHDLRKNPINTLSAFYMKKFGKNFIQVGVTQPESTFIKNNLLLTDIQYDYNFNQDYRIGIKYELQTADNTADASTWYVTLSKGLDFNGITDAMRHYM